LAEPEGFSETTTILVFGASGYIGANLVRYLRETGLKVKAAARSKAVLQAREWSDVDCLAGDALIPESLPAALEGVDTACYMVHSMDAGKNFGAIDLKSAASFRNAAATSGVRHIVYLSGPVPVKPESVHLKSRLETGPCLRQGPVPVTELLACMIIGPGSAAFEVTRDLVNNLPIMVTPRRVYSKSPPSPRRICRYTWSGCPMSSRPGDKSTMPTALNC
jgi:uncharacterized protein YbjT (DUF2867 family)